MLFIDALIGLVMTCSNSGSISPEAEIVFSILPISTTAVVMLCLLIEDEKEALKAITEATSKTTIEAAIKKPFLFFFRLTSLEILVSTFWYLP